MNRAEIEAAARYLASLPPLTYECHGCSAEVSEEDLELVGTWLYCGPCANDVRAMIDGASINGW